MTEQEMVVKLTEVEERSKSNTHRLDKMEKRQDTLDELAKSMARMDERQNNMDGDVKEIKADVKAIAEKPGKRWEGLADKALWLVIGAAIAALFAQAGVAL